MEKSEGEGEWMVHNKVRPERARVCSPCTTVAARKLSKPTIQRHNKNKQDRAITQAHACKQKV
jgi:hypothetical protein